MQLPITIVNIKPNRPSGILRSTIEGNLWSSSLAPAALEVAKHQTAAISREETVVDPEIAMYNAKGVEARESVDDVEDPAIIHLE